MKALTVYQPHATMLAIRLRSLETRGWILRYRGDLMIHAGKKFDQGVRDECSRAMATFRVSGTAEAAALATPFNGASLWMDTLGCVLAVARVIDCIPIPEPTGTVFDKEFGGFGPGRYGIVLENVRTLREPVKATGAQGLWTPKPELIRAVKAEL